MHAAVDPLQKLRCALVPGASDQTSEAGISQPVTAACLDHSKIMTLLAQGDQACITDEVAAADVQLLQLSACMCHSHHAGVRDALAVSQIQHLHAPGTRIHT